MAVELRIPESGESILEVSIAAWLKAEGDAVAKDEAVVEIETDKAAMELVSPAAGRLARILKQPGEAAQPGEVIAIIEEGAAAVAAGAAAAQARAAAPDPRPAPSPATVRTRVMPAARRLLEEHGLEAEQIEASGPGGRLVKGDVLRHVERSAARSGEPGAAAVPAVEPAARSGERAEEVVPMSAIRRRIAARLVEAKRNAALLTTFNEIDMTAVQALRRQHRDAFEKRHGVKLGLMSFFVKAVVDALGRVPELNAEVRGQDVVYRNYHDIGIAVGAERGLVVPVLRDAARLGFAAIERAIADFAARAGQGTLGPEELRGGTFTISNGGIYGSLLSTPIVNPPQSGILGLHAIQERPVALEGQVAIRPMMYVALTYDHRLVDGREAVGFLLRVKQAIEEPARILLEA